MFSLNSFAPKTSRIAKPTFITLWVIFLFAGCRFDTQGIEGSPDSGIIDGSADRDITDVFTQNCLEGEKRCKSEPHRVEICKNDEWISEEMCEFACTSQPQPRCGDPAFQNGIQNGWLDTNQEGNFIPDNGASVVIDTENMSITINGSPANISSDILVQDAPGAPEIMWVTFNRVLIHEDVTIRVTGSRTLALGSKDDLQIFGKIEAGGDGSLPGPGGGSPGEGTGRGGDGQGTDPMGQGAGGGGGYLAGGGNGDSSGMSSSGGGGGTPYGTTTLNTLVGGSGGGEASNAETATGNGIGGGGGGALMLFSRGEIYVGPLGHINAGGGGGRQGNTGKSGGGGGSGGAILIEAPRIKILGVLAANGGGGGGSYVSSSEHGENGRPSAEPASGGNSGGAGGAGTTLSGQNGSANLGESPGGGGGACGRIRLHKIFPPIFEEGNHQGTISPDRTVAPVVGELRIE